MPYWNQYFVDAPPGVTVPVKVSERGVGELAVPVAAEGAELAFAAAVARVVFVVGWVELVVEP